MYILSIDSSTRGCSVAIHGDGELLAAYELFTDRSSSAMLTTLIESALRDSGLTWNNLDALAVAKGPGSYTGLRVGVSTAKGICYAIDKPLIAVNTLEAMFMQVRGFFSGQTLFCPMIDARRMEVYTAIFDKQGRIVGPTNAMILQEDSFDKLLQLHQVVFFGDGAAKGRSLYAAKQNAVFIDDEIRPSARTVGLLAGKAFEHAIFENLPTFEPYYLKDFMTPPTRKMNLEV